MLFRCGWTFSLFAGMPLDSSSEILCFICNFQNHQIKYSLKYSLKCPTCIISCLSFLNLFCLVTASSDMGVMWSPAINISSANNNYPINNRLLLIFLPGCGNSSGASPLTDIKSMSGKKFLGCFSFCGGLFGLMKGFLGALLCCCCCCCCCWNLTWRFCCFRWSCCWMLFFCLSPIRAVCTISRVSGDRPSEESNKLSIRNRIFYVNHVSLQLMFKQLTQLFQFLQLLLCWLKTGKWLLRSNIREAVLISWLRKIIILCCLRWFLKNSNVKNY